MQGCTFTKWDQKRPDRLMNDTAAERARTERCGDQVFLDDRCFFHARVAEQMPGIMANWKMGEKTPLEVHASNGGNNKADTEAKKKQRKLPSCVYMPHKGKSYSVSFTRWSRTVTVGTFPTIEEAVAARDAWLQAHS